MPKEHTMTDLVESGEQSVKAGSSPVCVRDDKNVSRPRVDRADTVSMISHPCFQLSSSGRRVGGRSLLLLRIHLFRGAMCQQQLLTKARILISPLSTRCAALADVWKWKSLPEISVMLMQSDSCQAIYAS